MTESPEGYDVQAVESWIRDHVDSLEPPFKWIRLEGGHSNLTYRCDDSRGESYVLRRPPLGHVLESAHDMGREHKIIDALADSDVPVAPNYGLCQDSGVNGADFYVMRYVDGLILHDSILGAEVAEADRRALGLNVIETLAKLHLINPDDVGLGDLGRKEAYLSRQINRWTKQWEASKTHEIPEMEEACRILTETMPEQVGATIVHGDYRLDNMMFGGPYPLTVVDWQSYFMGCPIQDVSYFMGTSLASDVRRKEERALIKHYLDVLNHYGADLSFDDCFRYYVNFAPAGMIMALIASMIVGETERGNDMFMVMAKGSIALCLDHERL